MRENIIKKEWRERYQSLPKEIQVKLDEFDDKGRMTDELNIIKRTRKEIKTGDVFVIQHKSGIYFYGKVIHANIEQIHDEAKPYEGSHVVIITNIRSKLIEPKQIELSYDNCLTKPMITVKQCWTGGYFYTVNNAPLTKNEMALDYGFCSAGYIRQYDIFRKETGEIMNHQPKLMGTYAIGGIGSVVYSFIKEVIIDSTLLDLESIK